MTKAEKLKKRVEAVLDRLDKSAYVSDYTHYQFEVNVKVYEGADLDDFFDQIEPAYQERARKWLDKNDADLWYDCLEQQRRYIHEDYLKGHTINSREYNKEHGIEETEYEVKLRRAIDIIKDAGFYGRSGGHFCFNISTDVSELQAVLDALDNHIQGDGDDVCFWTLEECEHAIKEAELDIESAEFVCEDVKSMIPTKESFNEHYLFRVEQEIEDWSQETFCITCHQLV